jgi:hypothetical protein
MDLAMQKPLVTCPLLDSGIASDWERHHESTSRTGVAKGKESATENYVTLVRYCHPHWAPADFCKYKLPA